ncbi:MAG: LCP family protein [Ruminococcus sp.]|nr:LCP family protein [Ruminococcus sp.]
MRQDSRSQEYGRNSGGYYPPPPQRQTPKSGGNSKNSSGKKTKKKHRKSPVSRFIIKLLLTVLIIFSLLLLIYSCTAMSLIKKMEYVETGNRFRNESSISKNYVTNVLLIGTDGRTSSDAGRSDTIIMASANSRTNKVSLISFMRDSYVEIPGRGWDKLNASYSYGGAELLMDTIEHNFGVKIDDYVSLNFVSFANIVDSVGGIDIDINDAEMQEINTILQAEVNELMGDNIFDDLLDKSGKLHLNGKQALSYARIRYVGNADFERTERQRKVMELVMNKLKSLNPTIMPKLSASVLPGISTNINSTDMYFLSLKLPFIAGYERCQLQIPADGTYYDQYTSDGGQALGFDSEENFNLIYETAYGG